MPILLYESKRNNKNRENNRISPNFNVTNNTNIETTTSKASEPSKCILKKYSTTSTPGDFHTPNEEKIPSKTKYTTSLNLKDINPIKIPHTDPQPMELNTSISETTTEIIPDILRFNEECNKFLLTIRQPARSSILV